MEKRINPDFPKRPARYKVDALKEIGTATISAEFKPIDGIKDSFMMGPQSCSLGNKLGGGPSRSNSCPFEKIIIKMLRSIKMSRNSFIVMLFILLKQEMWSWLTPGGI
jgi:hypothetical protein